MEDMAVILLTMRSQYKAKEPNRERRATSVSITETAHRYNLDPNGGARAQTDYIIPLLECPYRNQGGTHKDLDELIEDIEFGVYVPVVNLDKSTQEEVHSSSQHGSMDYRKWFIVTSVKDVSVFKNDS